MTLKEADDAALRKVPILHNGTQYTRIIEVGYKYTDLGKFPFVLLEDRPRHSATYAKPSECVETVIEAEEEEYEKVERRVHKRRSNKR